MANPVVVIPGYLGSKLAEAVHNKLIWINGRSLLNPEVTLEALRLDIGDPDRLVPVGILDEVIVLPPFLDPNVYKELSDFLRANLNLPTFDFFYDWRKSIEEAADLLHKQITRWLVETGEARVDLVAHSLGGIVARAYLAKHGASKVDRLVTLGSPHKGALETFLAIVQGMRFLTFPARKVRQVTRTFPSAYEVLPYEAADSMFHADGVDANPYQVNGWCQTPEMKDLLADAAVKVSALLPTTLPVDSFLIYGTRQTTVTSASFSGGSTTFPRTPAGDGTVPQVSASGRGLTAAANRSLLRFEIPFGAHTRLFGLERVKQRILTPIMLRRDIPEVQLFAAFRSEPFFIPRTANPLAAAVFRTGGAKVTDATVRLTITGTTIRDRIVPLSPEGDYLLNVIMPGPGGGHPYKVTADVPGLPEPLTDRGLLVPTES